ncbi:hypothetical protein DERF_011418 [Dermatophagoides farinae]|uniref:Uncharacterized protein n=1 Tax=Dermatophagoides farinae TaxID=6954 RepID=A0A922HUX4_DERFA|nr:hypothetical protein DERF_011418 [Dermatophagoides farinae]
MVELNGMDPKPEMKQIESCHITPLNATILYIKMAMDRILAKAKLLNDDDDGGGGGGGPLVVASLSIYIHYTTIYLTITEHLQP